jgi:hypothetical protein
MYRAWAGKTPTRLALVGAPTNSKGDGRYYATASASRSVAELHKLDGPEVADATAHAHVAVEQHVGQRGEAVARGCTRVETGNPERPAQGGELEGEDQEDS